MVMWQLLVIFSNFNSMGLRVRQQTNEAQKGSTSSSKGCERVCTVLFFRKEGILVFSLRRKRANYTGPDLNVYETKNGCLSSASSFGLQYQVALGEALWCARRRYPANSCSRVTERCVIQQMGAVQRHEGMRHSANGSNTVT
jgi:hypothetical protein